MADKPLASLGACIRDLREKRQWSLETLAKKARVDVAHLGLIERGKRDPRFSTVAKIASGFGISVAELLADAK